MSIGIVSDADFEKELEQLKPRERVEANKNELKIVNIERGRGDKLETPENLRKVIAECAINNEARAANLAKIFNISPASVSAYKNGATSTASYNNPNESLVKHTNSVRTKISTRATKRIMMALKHITEDKIQDAKLKDIAALAKDMSSIVKNIDPDNRVNDGRSSITYHIYAPRVKSEEEYEVVDAIDVE